MTTAAPGPVSLVDQGSVVADDHDYGVAILLSTYNGARFLPNQLRSFRNQIYSKWRLIWRDDGSIDDTPAIMEDFSRSLPLNRVIRADNSGDHLGAFGSFFSLLHQALDAPAVAFADQDDIWLPHKLERALELLGGIDPERPALYCGRQILVDHSLQPIGLTPCYSMAPGFPGILLQNVATGCTIVMNQAAAKAVAASRKPHHSIHDWWSCLYVIATGGIATFDPDPAILYRQHETNLVGAPNSRLKRLRAALGRGANSHNAQLMAHVDALLLNAADLAPETTKTLQRIRDDYAGSWRDRLGLFRLPGFRRQTWPETALLGLWLLRGEPPDRMPAPPLLKKPVDAAHP